MNELKAGLWTLLFTFFGVLVVTATNLLAALENFVNGTDPTLTDDLSTASKVVASAGIALVAGVINLIYRLVQNRTPVPLPGKTPVYVEPAELSGGDVEG